MSFAGGSHIREGHLQLVCQAGGMGNTGGRCTCNVVKIDLQCGDHRCEGFADQCPRAGIGKQYPVVVVDRHTVPACPLERIAHRESDRLHLQCLLCYTWCVLVLNGSYALFHERLLVRLFPDLFECMYRTTVCAGIPIVSCSGEPGRNSLGVDRVTYARLVVAGKIVEIVDPWWQMGTILLDHRPIVNHVQGAAGSHCSQPLEILPFQLSGTWSEYDPLVSTRILHAGRDPLAPLPVVEAHDATDERHMASNRRWIVTFTDMVYDQAVSNGAHPLRVGFIAFLLSCRMFDRYDILFIVSFGEQGVSGEIATDLPCNQRQQDYPYVHIVYRRSLPPVQWRVIQIGWDGRMDPVSW